MSEYIVESRHTYRKTRVAPNLVMDLGTSEWTKVPGFEHKEGLKNSFSDADEARKAIEKEQMWDSRNLKTSKYEYRILKDGEEYTRPFADLDTIKAKIQSLIDSKYALMSRNRNLISQLRQSGDHDIANGLQVNVDVTENLINELKGLLK